MSRSSEVHGNDGPPRFSVGLSALAAVVVLVLVGPFPAALGVGLLGTLSGAVGVARDSGWLRTLGAAGLFGGVLLAGTAGRSPPWLLAATVPAVLSWVTARHACRLGRQVGRDAPTLRVELVHAVSTLAILVGGGGVGYLTYRSAVTSTSPLAVGLLLLAAVAFTIALR
ncbi:DUF7519 family protein [Haloarcula sp. GH36]|uniref:DUF7519 family protein n=1 Tax=Haloarcula montana TaxID=3111776 RepID=UPI002D7A33C5|nr:hypothetical protein [Haloarcula sp. GH36]